MAEDVSSRRRQVAALRRGGPAGQRQLPAPLAKPVPGHKRSVPKGEGRHTQRLKWLGLLE